MTIAISLFAIFLLIILSAFFNASETSLTAASRARMHALQEDGNMAATLVNVVLSRPKMIGTVLLGNTLVDVLAAALASKVAVDLYGEVGVAYATAAITILIVIFAAVLPKTYALAYADRVALIVAPIMRGLIYILTPFTKAIEFVVRQMLKLTPGKADDAANILARMRKFAAPSIFRPRKGPSPGAMRRCSAASSIFAICRSPTSWFTAPRWK